MVSIQNQDFKKQVVDKGLDEIAQYARENLPQELHEFYARPKTE